MKNTKLLALLLALLTAFACVAVAEEKADVVLASAYDGELTVTYADIKEEFDQMVAAYIVYYTQYGYSVDEYDVDMQNAVAQEIVQLELSQMVASKHAADTGYVLTGEKDAALHAEAETAYAQMYEYYKNYLTGYGFEGDELEQMINDEMAAAGFDVAVLYESAKLQAELDHLYALAIADVTVTEEEAKAAFAAKVSAQKESFADADAFINAYISGGEEILYTPENIRKMHCIYIAKETEAAAETAEGAEAAPLTGLAKAQDVLAKIRGGADFTEMMIANNEDSSSPEEMEKGYPVAAGCALYGDEFTAAAMALENVGDVSDVVVTDYGYFILRYAEDFAAGEVAFEGREETEMAQALVKKQNDAYTAYINGMLDESGFTVHDLSPLFNIYVAEVVEATVAYAAVTADADLCDMPAGDAVARLSAGASLDILGRIAVDGAEYVFAAVPGTAFKGYVSAASIANMEPDEALAVDNAALVSACEVTGKNPTFTVAMNDGSLIYGELYPQTAPQSVGNFVSLANSGFYNGLIFHRVIPGFMIQGGDPSGDGTGGPGYAIRGEFANNGIENPVSHVRGVISMARSSAMDSAGSQFFIMHADSNYLDGDYAAFGMTLGGLDTVDLIASVPTGSNDKPKTEQTMREVYVETYGQTYEFTKLDD